MSLRLLLNMGSSSGKVLFSIVPCKLGWDFLQAVLQFMPLLLQPPSWSAPFHSVRLTASWPEIFPLCYHCSSPLHPLYKLPPINLWTLNPPWHLLLGRLELDEFLKGFLWSLNEIIHIRCLAWCWIHSKSHWKVADEILRKKNKVGGITLLDFKSYYKAIDIKTVEYW